jgi:hypothetical protein
MHQIACNYITLLLVQTLKYQRCLDYVSYVWLFQEAAPVLDSMKKYDSDYDEEYAKEQEASAKLLADYNISEGLSFKDQVLYTVFSTIYNCV